jgi:transposase
MICKKCGSEDNVKNGMIRGKQRYKCKLCRFNFVAGDQREKVSSAGKALAILLYGRGKASYGFIARLLGVSSVAVMKWVKRESDRLPDPPVSSCIQEVSFDGMCHFVNKKKKNCGSVGQWSAFEIPLSAGVSGIVLLQHLESFSKSSSIYTPLFTRTIGIPAQRLYPVKSTSLESSIPLV